MNRSFKIGIEVFLWIAFCLLPLVFLPRPMHERFLNGEFVNIGWISFFVVKNVKFIVLFYIHQLILIPNYFSRGNYRKYLLFLGALFLLVLILPYLADHFFHHGHHGHHGPHPGHGFESRPRPPLRGPFSMDDGMHFFMTIIVALLPFLLHLYQNWAHASKAKTEMELSFLKSQINHHFLFNSLNSIYVLSVQGKPQTSESIHSLSFIMRYILDESEKRRTSLVKELDYIHHYIELQRLRLNEKVTLNCTINGDANMLSIAPMMLIPFIENCFKHGLSTVQHCTIDIRILIESDSLILFTKNDLIQHTNQDKIESGIGLANVTRRLEFEYFNAYTLSYGVQDSCFESTLKLKLI